jgi:serine/threonine protein phosphatase PrpC
METQFKIFKPYSLNEMGGRTNNEDAVYPPVALATDKNGLFLVCDGVGGAAKGEVASKILSESIANYFSLRDEQVDADFINKAISFAESKMSEYKLAHPESNGMASTLTLLSIRDGKVFVAWAGDSRVYQLRAGKIIYHTQDHSLVNLLVSRGEITPEEARNHPRKNQILKAVTGKEEPVKADIACLDILDTGVMADDYFFMFTDGVSEQLGDKDLERLCNGSISDEEIINTILQVCAGKTQDNFSCYLARVRQGQTRVAKTPDLVIEGSETIHTEPDGVKSNRNFSVLTGILVTVIIVLIAVCSYQFYHKPGPDNGKGKQSVVGDTLNEHRIEDPTKKAETKKKANVAKPTDKNTRENSRGDNNDKELPGPAGNPASN